MPGDFHIFGEGADATPQEALEALLAQVQGGNDMLSHIIAAGLTPIAARIDAAKDAIRKAGGSIKRQITKPFRAKTNAVNSAVGSGILALANRVGEAKNAVAQANAYIVAQQAISPQSETVSFTPQQTSTPFNVPFIPTAPTGPLTSSSLAPLVEPPPQLVQTPSVPSAQPNYSPAAPCAPWSVVTYPGQSPPPYPLPAGYTWVYVGGAAGDQSQWQCTPLGGYVPGGTTLSGVNGGNVSGVGPVNGTVGASQCSPPFYLPDGSCWNGKMECLLSWGQGDPNDPSSGYGAATAAVGPWQLITTDVAGQISPVGWYSQTYEGQQECAGTLGTGPIQPAPEPARPCELPPDVASWPGQRVVLLPYDLSQEGEKAASSECGKLMIDDAMKTVAPVSPLIAALMSDDPLDALLPGWDSVDVPEEMI